MIGELFDGVVDLFWRVLFEILLGFLDFLELDGASVRFSRS